MKANKNKKADKGTAKVKQEDIQKQEPYWFKRGKAKWGSSSFLDGTSLRDIIEAEREMDPVGLRKTCNSQLDAPLKRLSMKPQLSKNNKNRKRSRV